MAAKMSMKNVFEIIIGALVVAVVFVSLYFFYKSHNEELMEEEGYNISANFDNVDGIDVGSRVKISGIVVGKVSSIHLDEASYTAVIRLVINKKIKLPSDTSAQILTSGLLGEKYIGLIPGADNVFLKDGDLIEFTQSSINLENLITKFLFNVKEDPSVVSSEDEKEDGVQSYVIDNADKESNIS